MRVRAWLPALAGLVGLCPPLLREAAAQPQQTPYASVGGYDIVRNENYPKGSACQMSRSTRDAGDGDAEKVVIVSPSSGKITISFAYDRWNWKGQPPDMSFRIGERDLTPSDKIFAGGAAIGATFPDSVLPGLKGAERIAVGPKAGATSFDLGGFGPAYEAVLRCNRGEPAATSEPAPSLDRIAGYYHVLTMQDFVARCDVATSASQRAGLEAQRLRLQPQMSPYEAQVQKQRAATQGCPDPAKLADMEAALPLLLGPTPEAFEAELDRRAAARDPPAALGAKPSRTVAGKEPVACGPFPQTSAELLAALSERFRTEFPDYAVRRFVPEAGSNTLVIEPANATVGVRSAFVELYGEDGRIDMVSLSTPVDRDASRRVARAVLGHIVAAYEGRALDEATRTWAAAQITDRSRDHDEFGFGSLTVLLTNVDGEQTVALARTSGGGC